MALQEHLVPERSISDVIREIKESNTDCLTKITIKWTAFETHGVALSNHGRIANAEMTFDSEIPPAMADEEILELLFEQTNLRAGDVWKTHFEGKMPENKSHTALSVGDKVSIERFNEVSEYVCSYVGWEKQL